MLTCPKCNELNGDNNSNCFKCGAKLPQPVFSDRMTYSYEPKPSQNTNVQNIGVPNSVLRKPYSAKIKTLAKVVAIIGIILSVALSFIFKAAVVNDSHYYSYVEYTFNWGLCVSIALGTACCTILLAAMYYIAKAIEEK